LWLLDVAKEINPKSTLCGIDIHDRPFPKPPPPNMSFHVNSITALPSEWSERFDIVHQRLLTAALIKSEWERAVAEMYRVLKPGGWVQLCEPGLWTGGPATARLIELRARMYDHIDHYQHSSFIPNLLAQKGFVDVKVEKTEIPIGEWAGPSGCDARDNFIGVYRGLKPHLLRVGCFGMLESEKELDDLYDAVKREWDELKGCSYGFAIVVARKPNV
jgi:SAM-dependent methyltransferase